MTLRNKIEEAAVNQMKQVVKDVAVKQIKK